MNKGERSRKKRAMGNVESDTEKRIRRQMRYGGDNQDYQGSIAVAPETRYHVTRRDSRTENTERRICRNEVAEMRREGELEVNGDCIRAVSLGGAVWCFWILGIPIPDPRSSNACSRFDWWANFLLFVSINRNVIFRSSPRGDDLRNGFLVSGRCRFHPKRMKGFGGSVPNL